MTPSISASPVGAEDMRRYHEKRHLSLPRAMAALAYVLGSLANWVFIQTYFAILTFLLNLSMLHRP